MKNKLANSSGSGDWKREYFSIPNLMGYFRILLVPVFAVLYLRAETYQDYLLAVLVLGVSGLTDCLDGKVARKFNMVTEWGKFVDPVADKLTQAVTAICLTTRYPMMVAVVAVLLIKELTLAVLGLVFLRHDKKLDGASWCGKVATVVLDVGMLLLLLVPNLSYSAANIIMYVCIGFMIYALVGYIQIYRRMWLDLEQVKKKRKWKKGILSGSAVLLLFLVYVILGCTLPVSGEPELGDEYKASFTTADFYGEGGTDDRAAVIMDNQEALDTRLRMIAEAKDRIILSCFEIHSDNAGLELLAALYDAAERGVQVQMLVDGMPAFVFMDGNPYFYALSAHPNAEVREYNPVNLLKPWKLMSRMHDKYLIVDDCYYLIGGRNPYDYFLGEYVPNYKYDWDVLVCHDPANERSAFQQLVDYFYAIWDGDNVKRFHTSESLNLFPSVRRAGEELSAIHENRKTAQPELFDGSYDYEAHTVPTDKITLISGPTHVGTKEPEVFYAMCRLMEEAKEDVTIHTPYFVSNDLMRSELETLSKGDAKLRLMTNSSANNSNIFGGAFYQEDRANLLADGITLLEYDGGVSYHGKCIAVDDQLSMVGSFNMNPRSVYLDTETMLVIDGEAFNEQLRADMEVYEADSLTVVDEHTVEAPDGHQIQDVTTKQAVTYAIIRLLTGWAKYLI